MAIKENSKGFRLSCGKNYKNQLRYSDIGNEALPFVLNTGEIGEEIKANKEDAIQWQNDVKGRMRLSSDKVHFLMG